MVVLSDKKVEYLQSLINSFYETSLDNEFARSDIVSSIIGILDYVFQTDACVAPPDDDVQPVTTYSDFIREQPQDCATGSETWF